MSARPALADDESVAIVRMAMDLYALHPMAPQPIRHPVTGARAWWLVVGNPYWQFCVAIAAQVVTLNEEGLTHVKDG